MRISWASYRQDALDTLRDLLRLDTSNPPGNEQIATDYLAGRLRAQGIEPVILDKAPRRSNLVARIKGRDSSQPPLMLSSHTDVVPVELTRWSHPPFAAEIADGYLWGRGAIDMKSKLAMDLVLTQALHRSGAVTERDLIMAAVADEEAGSELGARFLVEEHPDLVRAGYVLNEVGSYTLHLEGRRFYPVQVAEKGFVTLKMTASGIPGHGAIPRENTAIVRMAALITQLTYMPMRKRLTPLMATILSSAGFSADDAPPIFRPMLSNTVSPTIVRAGYKDNVIPGEASVILDGRTVPGQDVESFIAEIRDIIGPVPKLEVVKAQPPSQSEFETPLFGMIARAIEKADPGAKAIPWMIPGATDSKFYARLGATCYGFAPVRLAARMPFGALYHSNDERLPIDGFFWGLGVYTDVVLEFLGLRREEVFS